METLIIKGYPVSGGIAIGKLAALEEDEVKISRGFINANETDAEIKRVEYSFEKCMLEIFDLKRDVAQNLDEGENMIFEAYRAILQDQYFIQEIKDIIKNECRAADYAVNACILNYIDAINKSENEYAKQRTYDLNDIRIKIIRYLHEENVYNWEDVTQENILFLKELNPTIAATAANKQVKGIVTQEGAGYLSHSAIILRAIGMPALNDIKYDDLKVYNGCMAVLDGINGLLMINPSEPNLEEYRQKADRIRSKRIEVLESENKQAMTLDGFKIRIMANINNFGDLHVAVRKNVDGIGVVRTEMLFYELKKIPCEDEQYEIYSSFAEKMKNKPIIIRTADFGGDKSICKITGLNENDISLRGIKRSLTEKLQFIIQLKAIIRASVYENLRVAFPMVNNVSDIMEAKKIIEKIIEEYAANGIDIPKNLKIGAVIETKNAIEDIYNIIEEVDFISIGTNDLYYELADKHRECEEKTDNFVYDLNVLKAVSKCVEIANSKNKEVSICGEMAADPFWAVVFIGIGIYNLSMNPVATSRIIDVITSISIQRSSEFAKMLLECKSKSEMEDIIKNCYVYLNDIA